MEGTRIADDDGDGDDYHDDGEHAHDDRDNNTLKEESEQLVSKESMKMVSSTNRLVLADFNFKDVDRLRTFLKIAKDNDRKLVVKMNDAYFLKHLSKDPKLNVPDVDDKAIIIYLPKKGSGKYQNSDYKGRDREFVGRHNTWNAQEIAGNESRVLCAMGFYSFTALIDMKPKPGATYIHSASEPYNEEQEISRDRIDAWVDHFGMRKFQSHCSGHAKNRDLLQIEREINAGVLYPIHTEHPEIYRKTITNVIEVVEGKRYSVS